MGDFGIKISKATKDVNTSSLSDTSLDSRYAGLILLEKKTMEWTADAGYMYISDTETYTHNLGYPPLILGYLSFYTQSQTYPDTSTTYILPYGSSVPTRGGTDLTVSVQPVIKENSVDLDWGVSESAAGTPVLISDDVVITVVLHIYSYKLGYET